MMVAVSGARLPDFEFQKTRSNTVNKQCCVEAKVPAGTQAGYEICETGKRHSK
jgi:hypothetical protein